jgi:hypothetical protein
VLGEDCGFALIIIEAMQRSDVLDSIAAGVSALRSKIQPLEVRDGTVSSGYSPH